MTTTLMTSSSFIQSLLSKIITLSVTLDLLYSFFILHVLCKIIISCYFSVATSMCFAEKQAYTQEVLAVVMQHLMELNPLPTLLMRTVIQSLSLYPRLIGFVMNILQRLIMKQVTNINGLECKI